MEAKLKKAIETIDRLVKSGKTHKEALSLVAKEFAKQLKQPEKIMKYGPKPHAPKKYGPSEWGPKDKKK